MFIHSTIEMCVIHTHCACSHQMCKRRHIDTHEFQFQVLNEWLFFFWWKIQEDNSWMVKTYNHIPFQMGILKEILFMSICFACLHFVSLSDPGSFKCCYCLLLLFMRITPSLTVSINCETLWFATVYLQLYQKYIQSDGNETWTYPK